MLIERLRRYPELEPALGRRQEEESQWRRVVSGRERKRSPIKVLFGHCQLPGETGSGTYTQWIAKECLRQGIDFHVIAAGYEEPTVGTIPGFPVERLTILRFALRETKDTNAVPFPIPGMSVVMPYPTRPFRDLSRVELETYLGRFFHVMKLKIQELQPDVLHVNHLWFLAGLARLAAPWIPLCISAHGTAYKLLIDRPRFGPIVVPTVATADHVCAISPASVAETAENFRVSRERISIEGYGVDGDSFFYEDANRISILRELGIPNLSCSSDIVLFVGKFVEWKGVEFLLEAIANLRMGGYVNLACIVIGEGTPERRAALEELVAKRDLTGSVFLPGKLPHSSLPDVYRSADVFVLPSFSEPWGLVLMEALACGVASVFANIGGPPCYVPNGLIDAGLVYPVEPIRLTKTGSPDGSAGRKYANALAEGILAIVERKVSVEERKQISGAMSHLRWDEFASRLHGIYLNLASRVREGAG